MVHRRVPTYIRRSAAHVWKILHFVSDQGCLPVIRLHFRIG